MTSILTCAVEQVPCPPEAQVWVTLEELFAPADLGVTPAAVFEVWGWGFGVVILFWFFGYCIGVAVDVVRKA